MFDNKCYMKNMRWQDVLQFVAMVLMGGAMPISWHLGLWAAVLLAVVSLVKIFADLHDGKRALFNPTLNGWMKAALGAAVAYVAIFAVSLLYSSNVDAGLNTLWHKAVLLIFPLCFLLTDTSWLKPVHVRIIFYALLVAVCFIVFHRFSSLFIAPSSHPPISYTQTTISYNSLALNALYVR